MKKLIVVTFGLYVHLVFASGPFGLEMGLPISSIDSNAREEGSYLYSTTNVPKPHSEFDYYVLKVAPTTGLCWIKAISKKIDTSVYGIELKSAFSEMNERLTKKYGKGETIDLLMDGSYYTDPKHFMMGMINKERILMTTWDSEKGSKLQGDLTKVSLVASSGDDGYDLRKAIISIEYSFSNKDVCDEEIVSQEDEVL